MHESSWRPLGMPTAARRAAKHSMRDDRRSEDFTLGTVSRRNDIALYVYSQTHGSLRYSCLYLRSYTIVSAIQL